MARRVSTGYEWVQMYKAEIQNSDYCVIFFRLRYAWYPLMSDCYEPTWEFRDAFRVEVMRWYLDRYGHKKAMEGISETAVVSDIDKAEANKIYWNLKNREIPFDEVVRYFKEIRDAQDAEFAKRHEALCG